MKSRKIVSASVASAIVAGALLVPGVSMAQEPEIIRIYSSLPLTVSAAAQNITFVNSINMAI